MVTTHKKGTADMEEVELYLMRSYDHPQRTNTIRSAQKTNTMHSSRKTTTQSFAGPDRQATAQSAQSAKGSRNNREINFGKASEDQIWEIARAASAPPMYFKPIRLRIQNGNASETYYFQDGGVSLHNNPTREAILDIRDQSGSLSLKNVVSIGTAKKNAILGPTATLIAHLRNFVDRATDPEFVASQVSDMADSGQYSYELFRFNAKSGSGHTLSTAFDEWKPRSTGADTIDYIEKAFNKWYNVEENRNRIHLCAKALVQIRHKRCEADPARWERFAACHEYGCRQEHCERVGSFTNRDEFENHLIDDHQFQRGDATFIDELEHCRASFPYKNPSMPR